MSTTELQVIHKHVNTAFSASKGFFHSTDGNQSEGGLIMKIDNNLLDSTKVGQQSPAVSTAGFTVMGMKNPSAVRPSAVSSQLCGQGHEVTGWVLRGILFLQTTHIPFIKFTHKVSTAIQKKVRLLLPAFFYLSLLVLVAQVAAVVFLFYQSFMPIGMWFLLSCIGILAGMFCYTISSTWKNHIQISTILPNLNKAKVS